MNPSLQGLSSCVLYESFQVVAATNLGRPKGPAQYILQPKAAQFHEKSSSTIG